MKSNQNEETNFPIKTNSRLITELQKLITLSIKVLAVLMALVVLWSTIDVIILLYQNAIHPPYALLDIEDILGTFGAFLVVLIAVEIFINIILYLRKDISHLKMVVATALMAISRKVIILDYETIEMPHLYGMASVIVALGITYWLLQTNQSNGKVSDYISEQERP